MMAACAQRLGIVAALAAASAGCNGFGYISGTYVTLKPQVVTIGCNEPYEVYDRRDGAKMLIVSNALREVAGCGLADQSFPSDPEASRRVRFRAAAEAYLRETQRDACRIGTETAFGALQTEFTYLCPGPAERPGDRIARLPGRR
jgi:hypothetical protein